MRAIGKLLLVVGAVAAAVWLVRFLLHNPPDEVAEMVAGEGVRTLRDPLRPIRGETRLLVFALDGVGHSMLQEAFRTGVMPKTAAFLGDEQGDGLYEHAYAAPGVLSILPSTTMAAWSSLYTGAPPAQTGVPGNEWFERERAHYMAPAPVSVVGHEHTLEMLNDGLVGNAIRVPTVFERLNVRSHVSLAPVYRGADVYSRPEPAILLDAVAEVAQGIAGGSSIRVEGYSEIDLESAEAAVAAMQRHGVPDLQVVYFPAVDLYTHVAEDPLRSQMTYLRTTVDSAVGLVLDAYERAGLLDSLYVLFTADHGHTPVQGDDRHALSSEGQGEPTAVLEALDFRMQPDAVNPQPKPTYQAAVAYQGAMGYLYLADRSTCPNADDLCDWARPPRMAEEVIPVARAFHQANTTGAHVPALRGTLDLILAREPRPTTMPALPFQVFDGERLVPIPEYLARNPRPDLVAFEERMNGLAAGPFGHRAGDVLLLARSGADRPVDERFYFSNEYRSWHGSPSMLDSNIPLLVAARSLSGGELRSMVQAAVGPNPSQLDVSRLIETILANPADR